MMSREPAEIVQALERTIAWVEDPKSRKCHGSFARVLGVVNVYSDNRMATHFCAIGRLGHELNMEEHDAIMLVFGSKVTGGVMHSFDSRDYASVARVLRNLMLEWTARMPAPVAVVGAEQRELTRV